MKHSSIRLNTPCEFINIIPVNPLISKCEIKVLYVGEDPNRNGSVITKDVATKMAASLPGSPIVGFFNKDKEDFEGHSWTLEMTSEGEVKFTDITKPYGFVDLGAKVWFQEFLDDGENKREYLMTEGYLWTGQYPEAKRIIEQGNNQSMELDQETLEGAWVKKNNEEPEFFIINEAIISKLCILGEDTEPCFEGASITKVQFSFGDEFNQNLYSLIQAVKEIEEKGGEFMFDEKEEVVQTEEEVTTEFEAAPEAIQEEVIEEEVLDEVVQYNLEEIPEYIELKEQYAALQTEFSQLQESNAELVKNNEELQTQIEELTQFKLEVERKEKQHMINEEFYMLSDNDKADVIENIDKYSLDEIEAKLSVICVRNKVSFDLDEDKDDAVITYSYNDNGIEEDSIPDWIKAVQETKKKNNV